MAIISSYPTVTPTSSDLVLIVDTSEDGNPTKTATIGSVGALATAPDIKVATKTITNAQLLTLGTVPVEILPAVNGYVYEIIGIVTRQNNTGQLNETYNWTASGKGVFYGLDFDSNQHRLEIPTAQLPPGGATTNGVAFVGVPIEGTFKTGVSLRLSTTLSVDPSVTAGQSPNATWKINITYRSIQAS